MAGHNHGLFNAGDRLRFHGTANASLYARAAHSRLELAASNNARARIEASAAQAERTLETVMQSVSFDKAQVYNYSAPAKDPWAWRRVVATTQASSEQVAFALDNLAPGAASITISVWGGVDFEGEEADHHVRFRLNGSLLAAERFDGLTERSYTYTVPVGLLLTSNVLELELPADTGYAADVVYLDRLKVDYPARPIASGGALSLDLAEFTGVPDDEFFGSGFELASVPCSACTLVEVSGIDAQSDVLAYRAGLASLTRIEGLSRDSTLVRIRSRLQSGEKLLVLEAQRVARPGLLSIAPSLPGYQGAIDYLAIAHPSLIDGLGSLLSLRRTQGLRAEAVDIDSIYATYSQGEADPTAIERYLRDLMVSNPLRYIVLVGGDSYDYRNDLGTGSFSFVPSLYLPVDRISRFTPSDQAFLRGVQNGSLSIGRLPARTRLELDTLIGKILRYEQGGRGHAALVADGRAGALDFRAESEAYADLLPSGFGVTRAYRDDLSAVDVRAALVGAINGGARLVNYAGHSSASRWGIESLLTAQQISSGLFTNSEPTAVVQWGCWNAYYVDPARNSMAHAWLQGDYGAALVLGATALTEAEHDRMLAERLLPRLRAGVRFGDALREAKQALDEAQPGLLDMQYGVNLLGDPAQQF